MPVVRSADAWRFGLLMIFELVFVSLMIASCATLAAVMAVLVWMNGASALPVALLTGLPALFGVFGLSRIFTRMVSRQRS